MTDNTSMENINVVLRFLLENNEITEEEVNSINEYAATKGVDTLQALQESGIFGNGENLVAKIAELSGYNFIHLDQIDIDRHALNLLDQQQASKLSVIPYALIDKKLFVAVPINLAKSVQLKTDIRRLTKASYIELTIASRKDIIKAIDTLYRSDSELANLGRQALGDKNNVPQTETLPDEITGESDVVRFVDLVLKQGVKDQASDIHFDPQADGLKVRYRVDGLLQAVTEAPSFMIPEIVSRIKIMASLDISKTREPQDGRLSLTFGSTDIDFRIATLPSIWGEKIVMRILDNSSAQLALKDLGLSDNNLERFRGAAHKPYGIVLVTGPTGSGKSTTLYSALNEINSPEINIITVEDPVEYQLPGITQIPVRHNLTFERVLRTVLRADPNIILIGEIRDRETAAIAMQAGMTGHMVFSTLHTNNAASALSRLGDMGVEPFITANTVEAIVSQRLIRKLCSKCKEETTLGEEYLASVNFNWLEPEVAPTFYKPVGCKVCNKTGYKGRSAIHEVLLMSDPIEEAIVRGAKALELEELARKEGMLTLKEDGFNKVGHGLTTIQEILRVVA